MSMSTSEGICANCGKGEEAGSSLKACTACKLVKYCSRDCQLAHRPQHKRRHVKNELLNCMMKNYLNNLRQMRIALSV